MVYSETGKKRIPAPPVPERSNKQPLASQNMGEEKSIRLKKSASHGTCRRTQSKESHTREERDQRKEMIGE